MHDSLWLHSLERHREHESLYTKGIILKDVRCNSWQCFTLRGLTLVFDSLLGVRKLLSLHSPQSVPHYTQFCQSSLPVNDKKRHFKQTSSQYSQRHISTITVCNAQITQRLFPVRHISVSRVSVVKLRSLKFFVLHAAWFLNPQAVMLECP